MWSAAAIERRLKLLAAAAMLGIAASSVPGGVATSAVERPNIVLVLLDDADKASAEALPKIRSLIAEQGLTFDRAYTPLSQCCPSRASILTGRYVHNHRVFGNRASEKGGFSKFRSRGLERHTLATSLRRQGYGTALVGKYLNEYGPDSGSEEHVPPSWNRWFAQFGQDYYDYKVNVDGRIRTYGSDKRAYATSVFSRAARSWIRKIDGRKPFFAFTSFTAPHSPYVDPPRHRSEFRGARPPSFDKPSFNEGDMSDKPRFYRRKERLNANDKRRIASRYRHRMRMLLAVDDFVGKLVADLETAGELDNTYIFVTSDNGWMQGEHRRPVSKAVAYEESINMPLMVRGPGIVPGTTSERVVSLVDLFPTFVELGGGTERRDGRSLVPLLSGADVAWRDRVLVEWTGVSRPPRYAAVVTDRYKYVRHAGGERELYDLQADPFELTSIHRSEPGVVADLNAKLTALRRCSGQECRDADGGP